MGGQISITHPGVVEVEESRTKPDTPTEHFAAFNVIQGTFYNSPVQQGSTGSVLIQQDSAELRTLIEELVATFNEHLDQLGLTDEQRDEALAELMTLEAQAGSPKDASTSKPSRCWTQWE